MERVSVDQSHDWNRWGVVTRPHLVSILILAVLPSVGCVHRRMTIRSNPPGALVLLEGEEVGYTPMSLDFTYYGTREITLIKDGFETRTVMQKVKSPWYQKGPLEFATDNFALHKINNRHEFNYDLEPVAPVSNQDLRERAEGLRTEVQSDSGLPVGEK